MTVLGFLNPGKLKHLTHDVSGLLRSRLWAQVLVGMILGIGMGMLLGRSTGVIHGDTLEAISNWLSLPGHLFLTIVQMVMVPLVVASIITGMTSSGSMQKVRNLGISAGIYFICTTSIAISIGIGMALLLQPGQFVDTGLLQSELGTIQTTEASQANGIDWATMPNAIVTLIPVNPISSMVNNEMMQVVLFSILLGIALLAIPSFRSRALVDFFQSVQAVSLKIVSWAMKLAPIAVFGLLAQITLKTGLQTLAGMSMYMLTVILGLMVLYVVYLLLVWLLGRTNPWTFIKAARNPQLLAFSTSSSAAVMPVTIESAEKELGVKEEDANFIIPLGATINMDGTALYQGVATVFLAQVFGVDLTLSSMVLVLLASVGASIGTPSTPGVGIIILSTVLATVGIPPAGIALIIGVDRILDMCRTILNVSGDLVASVVVPRLIGEKKQFKDKVAEAVSG